MGVTAQGSPVFWSDLAAPPLCLNTRRVRGLQAHLARWVSPGVAAEDAVGISHPPMLVKGTFSPLSRAWGAGYSSTQQSSLGEMLLHQQRSQQTLLPADQLFLPVFLMPNTS